MPVIPDEMLKRLAMGDIADVPLVQAIKLLAQENITHRAHTAALRAIVEEHEGCKEERIKLEQVAKVYTKQRQKDERRVNPEMITLARESRGLTQSELANRLTITQGALSKIEGGIKTPSQELIEKLGKELDYPIEFFYSPEPVYGLGIGALCHFK